MRSFPWDSKALYQDEKTGYWMGDRQSTAQDTRDINKIFWSDGVCMAKENAFQVTPGEGMSVIVSPGICSIQGTLGIEDSPRALTLQAASSEDRIDTIVARWNANIEARKIDLYVITGVAQAVPAHPTLNRSESVWELGVADVFVAKNTGAISAARITDTRLQTERCGMMTPLLEVDTTTFYNQLQAAIDERTAELEEQTRIAVELAQSAIDGTTAGNLQNQITENKNAIEANSALDDERWESLTQTGITNCSASWVTWYGTKIANLSVRFDEPRTDSNYFPVAYVEDDAYHAAVVHAKYATVNGFTVTVQLPSSAPSPSSLNVRWLAIAV